MALRCTFGHFDGLVQDGRILANYGFSHTLHIWEPCSSHFSVLCPWIWTFVPKNMAYYRLAIYILPYLAHLWAIPVGVVSVRRRPSSVVRRPSSVNFRSQISDMTERISFILTSVMTYARTLMHVELNFGPIQYGRQNGRFRSQTGGTFPQSDLST